MATQGESLAAIYFAARPGFGVAFFFFSWGWVEVQGWGLLVLISQATKQTTSHPSFSGSECYQCYGDLMEVAVVVKTPNR